MRKPRLSRRCGAWAIAFVLTMGPLAGCGASPDVGGTGTSGGGGGASETGDPGGTGTSLGTGTPTTAPVPADPVPTTWNALHPSVWVWHYAARNQDVVLELRGQPDPGDPDFFSGRITFVDAQTGQQRPAEGQYTLGGQRLVFVVPGTSQLVFDLQGYDASADTAVVTVEDLGQVEFLGCRSGRVPVAAAAFCNAAR